MNKQEQRDFGEPLDQQTKHDIKDRLSEGRGASGIASAKLMKAIQIKRQEEQRRNNGK